MRFKIKSNASIIDGSRNFFIFIKLIQNLDPFVLDIIKPAIDYWAHSENVLIPLLNSSDEEKQFVIKTISKIRTKPKIDIINYSANKLENIIEWENATEPPLIINKPIQVQEEWKEIPCHSQAVERSKNRLLLNKLFLFAFL